jgi:Concanavalin A-like lectin/glucanases superfamily
MCNFRRHCLRLAAAALFGIVLVSAFPLRAERSGTALTSVSVPKIYLKYNGIGNYAEIASDAAFSLSGRGLTIAVWMRPDTLVFPKKEGSKPNEKYVHWLGKGEVGNREWTFRMYSLQPPGPRQNRISFYVFNPAGNRGCGSYFQDPLRAGEWMEVVGVADALNKTTAIYKNGKLRHTDSYATLTPSPGSAPLRFGTREFDSFFKGAIGPVLIWDRPLAAGEVKALHASSVVPSNGLVARFPNDEGSGTALHDSVGGKIGAVHGAAWQTGKGPVGITTGSSGGGC